MSFEVTETSGCAWYEALSSMRVGWEVASLNQLQSSQLAPCRGCRVGHHHLIHPLTRFVVQSVAYPIICLAFCNAVNTMKQIICAKTNGRNNTKDHVMKTLNEEEAYQLIVYWRNKARIYRQEAETEELQKEALAHSETKV